MWHIKRELHGYLIRCKFFTLTMNKICIWPSLSYKENTHCCGLDLDSQIITYKWPIWDVCKSYKHLINMKLHDKSKSSFTLLKVPRLSHGPNKLACKIWVQTSRMLGFAASRTKFESPYTLLLQNKEKKV
jgi:hypothetical protein